MRILLPKLQGSRERSELTEGKRLSQCRQVHSDQVGKGSRHHYRFTLEGS